MTIFPLYISPTSFEKCLLNWGRGGMGQGLIEFDWNFECCLSIHEIMGKYNALYDFWKNLFFWPTLKWHVDARILTSSICSNWCNNFNFCCHLSLHISFIWFLGNFAYQYFTLLYLLPITMIWYDVRWPSLRTLA